jgi:hypothetical protein
MAGRLADEDPQQALAHARAARRLGGRLALVREGAGITAYLAGEWAEALNELRAARRIGGDNNLLHVIADCERALGRPERALDIARGPEVARLPVELKVEMAIVEAGARLDLGQFDAAVLVLQSVPGASLSADTTDDWTPRLWYAYADSLLAAGRSDEAVRWFTATRDIDEDGLTNAAERLAELGGSPDDALTVVEPNGADRDSVDYDDVTEEVGSEYDDSGDSSGRGVAEDDGSADFAVTDDVDDGDGDSEDFAETDAVEDDQSEGVGSEHDGSEDDRSEGVGSEHDDAADLSGADDVEDAVADEERDVPDASEESDQPDAAVASVESQESDQPDAPVASDSVDETDGLEISFVEAAGADGAADSPPDAADQDAEAGPEFSDADESAPSGPNGDESA